MRCRIFPYERAPGPANMACDEALLDLVAGDPSFALLRTYGWTEPTLSLGYFQSIREVETDPRWRRAALVRRPTGGGAIWHHHELTYALALPAAHPLARPHTALYRAVHSVLASLLRAHGLAVDPVGSTATLVGAARPFLCFVDRAADDIVYRGAKIVGSAQRRRRGAILQHGSLLLAASPGTPGLLGVRELSTAPTDPLYWSDLVSSRIPEVLGFVPVREDDATSLRRRAEALEVSAYKTDSWTRRR
jgi:lipoate-protein ligase A